jgi:ABC-2 type transport system ATP-binding protein
LNAPLVDWGGPHQETRLMALVELERISKTYDSKIAVRDLSLRIDPGTMFGLLGPNGAGKTSSIRMMIGITLPDSGTVRLFGEPFHRKLLRRVGYLPEERGLYSKMKVLDQLTFMGQLHGLDATTAEKRGKAWCERLGLTECMGSKTETLSRGMQQKVQFIASLLHEPDLIIMDEPFSGLDPVNSRVLEETLLGLRESGKAILFSTHRMDQVEKLCDFICLVDRGQAVLTGSMREVKSRFPRDRIALEFEGDGLFLKDPMIEESKNYGSHVELRLKSGADPQRLLHLAAGSARILRFELMEPSLEEIFIRTVGGRTDA